MKKSGINNFKAQKKSDAERLEAKKQKRKLRTERRKSKISTKKSLKSTDVLKKMQAYNEKVTHEVTKLRRTLKLLFEKCQSTAIMCKQTIHMEEFSFLYKEEEREIVVNTFEVFRYFCQGYHALKRSGRDADYLRKFFTGFKANNYKAQKFVVSKDKLSISFPPGDGICSKQTFNYSFFFCSLCGLYRKYQKSAKTDFGGSYANSFLGGFLSNGKEFFGVPEEEGFHRLVKEFSSNAEILYSLQSSPYVIRCIYPIYLQGAPDNLRNKDMLSVMFQEKKGGSGFKLPVANIYAGKLNNLERGKAKTKSYVSRLLIVSWPVTSVKVRGSPRIFCPLQIIPTVSQKPVAKVPEPKPVSKVADCNILRVSINFSEIKKFTIAVAPYANNLNLCPQRLIDEYRAMSDDQKDVVRKNHKFFAGILDKNAKFSTGIP